MFVHISVLALFHNVLFVTTHRFYYLLLYKESLASYGFMHKIQGLGEMLSACLVHWAMIYVSWARQDLPHTTWENETVHMLKSSEVRAGDIKACCSCLNHFTQVQNSVWSCDKAHLNCSMDKNDGWRSRKWEQDFIFNARMFWQASGFNVSPSEDWRIFQKSCCLK